MKIKIPLGAALLIGLTSYGADTIPSPAAALTPTITVEAGKLNGNVSPLLYGLMTEEINHCYDGGLYAELVQNRAFLDDPKSPVHWSAASPNRASTTIQLDEKQALNSALPVSLRLDAPSASKTQPAGIANDGYWGIPVYSETTYRASFYAKAAPGFTGKINVSIQSQDGATVYAQGEAGEGTQEGWKRYEVVLHTGKVGANIKGRYVLSIQQPGTVWFSLVSLFPPTWKDRPNGLRKDLMQMLVDMKPQFLRFPGGNYLEGDTVKDRFDWKKTLGPISGRSGHPGPWHYRSTDGMGLMEFLTWCEDMQAEPLLAVYAGYSFKEKVDPGPALEPFVQEALEEIEYVTGPVTSKWGAQRAKDGHPAPFKLHYVEIGNEDFFDKSGSYNGRFTQISNAIKKKYPQLQCISTVGLDQSEKLRVRDTKPDAIDEHYYRSTDEFVKTSPDYYEKYRRTGPKVFVGEWAAHEDAKIRPWQKGALQQPVIPNMKAALGDAAFMAAMERNSDLVVMQCYAPLFANVNPGAWQWRPNLIGYDALRAYGAPSYYAIAMFSRNLGNEILKITSKDTPVQASATRDGKTREIFLKLVNPQPTEQAVSIQLKGIASVAPTASSITLAANPEETNTLDEPTKVAPKNSTVSGIKNTFEYTVPANGIVVLKLQASL